MIPLDLARAAAASTGEARAASQDALCAALRSGLGYALPDGTHCRTWREAYRAWTALARGAEPGKPGRPRSATPRVRGPVGRPSVRARTLAEVLQLLEEVEAAYVADGDATAREAAAGVRYAAERVRALGEPSGNPG